jgi:hypothetical protein
MTVGRSLARKGGTGGDKGEDRNGVWRVPPHCSSLNPVASAGGILCADGRGGINDADCAVGLKAGREGDQGTGTWEDGAKAVGLSKLPRWL